MSAKPANTKSKPASRRQMLVLAGGAAGTLFLLPLALLPFTPKSDPYLLFAALLWSWLPFTVAVALGGICAILLFSKWPWRKKLTPLLAGIVALVWIAKGLGDDCNLAGLAGEDDGKAAVAFTYLSHSLSDSRIDRLFANRELDDNVRFYLAIISAKRGLEFRDDPLLRKPGVTDGNRYLESARAIGFPIHYADFAKVYREQAK